MIAVIFEVWPKPEHRAAYLEVAATLLPELESLPGFISVERFESLTTPGKILSLSVFEDQRAVDEWRRRESHRRAQELGRSRYFENYRLRVASVLRDYGAFDREAAPPRD